MENNEKNQLKIDKRDFKILVKTYFFIDTSTLRHQNRPLVFCSVTGYANNSSSVYTHYLNKSHRFLRRFLIYTDSTHYF